MDHRDQTEVLDPLAVEDLISCKLNDRRKLTRLITQYRNILSNISEGTAFLLPGVTEKHPDPGLTLKHPDRENPTL